MSTHYGKSKCCGAYLVKASTTSLLHPESDEPVDEDQDYQLHINDMSNLPPTNNEMESGLEPEPNANQPQAPTCAPAFFERRHPNAGERSSERYGTQWEDLRDLQEDPNNPYPPFASRMDWQMGDWLARSGLSQAKIDELLHTDYVRTHFLRLLILLLNPGPV